MKKIRILAILLCMVMLLTLAAACGGNGETASTSPGSSTSPSGAVPSDTASSPDASVSPGTSTESGGEAPPVIESTPAASGMDTVNVAVQGDYGTLNPTTVTGDYWQVLLCIFEPLWDVTFNGDITYLLAESYEAHDSRHWTIKLKEGITFSNGNPFTAEDFVFSAELARDIGGIVSSGRIQDFDWEKIKAIDEYTIDMYWTTDRAEHIFFEIIGVLPMLDKESYDEADSAVNPIGTGPYVVSEYVINSHCYLTRRDDYWGDLPSVKNLNFKVLAEPSQRANAIATGDVDIASIATQDVEYVKGLPNIDVRSRYSANWLGIRFNVVEGNLFHDINARRAVAHAINKQALLDVVYGGLGETMNSPMTKAALDYLPEYDNTDDTYTIGYNIDVAKQYADQAGLSGKEIRIITNGTAEHVRVAEMLLNMLGEIGLTVQINNYDASSFTDNARNPEMYEIAVMRDFAPRLNVGGGLINFIRYSPIFTAPGSWEEAETFPEWGMNIFFVTNEEESVEITSEIVNTITSNVLIYGLVDHYVSEAFVSDLPNPYTYIQAGYMLHSRSLTPQ